MRRITALVLLLLVSAVGFAQVIERVEPPCWWVGMKTDLQLLIKGENIRGSTLILAPEDAKRGVSVGKIHNGDSPNYIFADIKIGAKTRAAGYHFNLVTPNKDSIRFEYTLHSREKGSAQRASFGPQDVVYLLMPDRFANGDSSNDSVEEAIEKCDRSLPEGRMEAIFRASSTIWTTLPSLELRPSGLHLCSLTTKKSTPITVMPVLIIIASILDMARMLFTGSL